MFFAGRFAAGFMFVFMLLAFPAHAEAPKVVTTIAPLGGIAAAVMEGAGQPVVLLGSNDSPHTHQLSPMDAAHLMEADIILWAGPGLESFLVKPMENLPRPSRVINLSKVETLTRYFSRTGGVWEEDDHEGEHEQGGLDPHLWLDPDNAAVIAWMIAEKLAEKDFTRSETYRANARKFAERLKQEDAAIRAQLEPLGRKPFIVFHDAFQYFEKQYRLNGAGAITLSPDEQPSAGRVAQLRSRIEAQKVACVFAEPQFAPALLTTLTEGTQVKTGTLNPDASDLPLDANLYFNWLHRLADGFEECLK